MSKYPTATERAEEMETLMAALAIIQVAELDLDEKPPILPVQCAHYLIAADADLLIVPTKPSAVGDHHIVEDIMCLSRCDALLVRVARPSADEKRVLVDIGIDGLVPVWFREYRPCLIQRALHFVPDQDASKPAFKLTKHGLERAADFDALSSEWL